MRRPFSDAMWDECTYTSADKLLYIKTNKYSNASMGDICDFAAYAFPEAMTVVVDSQELIYKKNHLGRWKCVKAGKVYGQASTNVGE